MAFNSLGTNHKAEGLRDEETKRLRVKESKSQRVKESKRLRDKERRVGERKAKQNLRKGK